MWYFIVGVVVVWIIYRQNQKKQPELSLAVSIHVDNSEWEETKKQKARSLAELKESFQPAQDNEEAIQKGQDTTNEFVANYNQSLDELTTQFQQLKFPDDLIKKEVALRKELNKHYKNRDDQKSKAFAIFLAYKHAEFLLLHPDIEWKNFAGLQKLQSNWKAEEYFNSLFVLMHAFQKTFPNSPKNEKLSKDIERTFELWNSRNIAKKTYKESIKFFSNTASASDKHFIILGIIEYLERRYKFNPQHRDKLVDWCHKDIELYEHFLKEFHEYQLFTFDDQIKFYDNPALKQKRLSSITFERVKRLKDYLVPRLNSYDVLEGIYKQESNSEKLDWLRNIGKNIKYAQHGEVLQEDAKVEALDISAITRTIEIPKSGQKGKLAFLNSLNEPCSTEDAFKDDAEKSDWHVMRAEVSFWQAMFCLSFWDEIFDGMGQPTQGQDIPHDLFQGDVFYLNRQQQIDLKYENLKQQNLLDFVNQQIQKTNGAWTRLIFNGDQDMLAYSKSRIVQDFLKRIDPKVFAKIVYRIAQNLNEHRAGVPDFVIWNEQELKMIEVKKVRGQVRESQKFWLAWMLDENIPVEIVRIKAK